MSCAQPSRRSVRSFTQLPCTQLPMKPTSIACRILHTNDAADACITHAQKVMLISVLLSPVYFEKPLPGYQ